MSANIGLIDYGMGNLFSVRKAFQRLDKKVVIVKSPDKLKNCDALILPGVGSFDPAMERLNKTELIPYIKEWCVQEKPFLGICLGLQLLFDSSEEGSHKGLGIIKGKVKRLPSEQKERIPHMGWSKLTMMNQCPLLEINDNQSWMYFVHSYSAIVENVEEVSATVPFGDFKITALVWKDNLGACQFHPEKSGEGGQEMLLKWVNWIEN